MRAIPQLVSAPLNPIPVAEQKEPPTMTVSTVTDNVGKIMQSKIKTLINELNVHVN